MIKLKEIDKKILKELLINGREDLSKVAKNLSVKPKTVWNRYMVLKKAGVIIGATTHVHYRKCYGIYTFFTIKMLPDRRDKAIENIRKMPKVYVIVKGNQKTILSVGITIENLNQIDIVKNKLSSLTLADEIISEIWLEIINIPENLKTLKINKQNYSTDKKTSENKLIHKLTKTKIDKIDMKIIDLLSINGRMPFSQIAKKVGKSSDTIAKRYNKLVESNLLKIVIQINPIKLGYKGWMIFNLNFSAKVPLQEKIKEITKIPDVIHLVKAKGPYDLVVYVFVKDIDQILEMQNKFSNFNDLIKISILTNEILQIWPTPKQCKTTF